MRTSGCSRAMGFVHTIFVCIADWYYLIHGFGEPDYDYIPWYVTFSDYGSSIGNIPQPISFQEHWGYCHLDRKMDGSACTVCKVLTSYHSGSCDFSLALVSQKLKI